MANTEQFQGRFRHVALAFMARWKLSSDMMVYLLISFGTL